MFEITIWLLPINLSSTNYILYNISTVGILYIFLYSLFKI